MIRKNIYSRITESIIKAHNDNNLDTAMEDGHEMDNMGKKIVAIITADPDQDLDWESEYEPFGATELTDEDEKECCEHEGIESDHELCPSCGYDVDCEGDECEDDDSEENDDTEDLMIGGGFDDEAEDDYEDMDVKDILVDILQELKGEDSDSSEESSFDTSDDNPMFGSSSDDESDEDDDDDDDEDYDSMLSDNGSSEWETSDDEESDDDNDDYDEEEDFESPFDKNQEVDEAMFDHPSGGSQSQEQEEDEVYVFDALDNA